MANKLTYNTRHRRSFFGKMILQVETYYMHSPSCYNLPFDEEAVTLWRDATWDEVSQFNVKLREGN